MSSNFLTRKKSDCQNYYSFCRCIFRDYLARLGVRGKAEFEIARIRGTIRDLYELGFNKNNLES